MSARNQDALDQQSPLRTCSAAWIARRDRAMGMRRLRTIRGDASGYAHFNGAARRCSGGTRYGAVLSAGGRRLLSRMARCQRDTAETVRAARGRHVTILRARTAIHSYPDRSSVGGSGQQGDTQGQTGTVKIFMDAKGDEVSKGQPAVLEAMR